MKLDLGGRRALVTGASRGIGRAVAHTLADFGATVVGVARSAMDAQEILPLRGDLGDPVFSDGVVDAAEQLLGGSLQIVVVCHASMQPMAKMHSVTDAMLEETLKVDLEGVVRLLRAATTSLMANRWGRIVLVTSAAASVGEGGAPLYCASKAALEGLARNLAIDMGRFGVTANVVAPGFVATERLQKRRANATGQLDGYVALRRLAEPQEIANVVAFLCSEAASYVSGAVLPVTGGAHLMNLW